MTTVGSAAQASRTVNVQDALRLDIFIVDSVA